MLEFFAYCKVAMVHFTDQNWIHKNVYCTRCEMVCKIDFTKLKCKNRPFPWVHGHYLLYQTFLNRDWQTQQYFNVSTPSSHKDNKNWLDCLERASFILFLPLGVIDGLQSPYNKENYSPENQTRVPSRRLFLPYFFWIKLWHRFFK